MIFGAALLAGCMLVGSFIGNVLGYLIGLNSDVGGVGFAMLLLLLVVNSKKLSAKLPKGTSEGLTFWKEMFIPVIIANPVQRFNLFVEINTDKSKKTK